jgi:hypothetical protein
MFSKTIITVLAGVATLTGAKFGYNLNDETITYVAGIFILAAQGFGRLGFKKAENASKEVSQVLKQVNEELSKQNTKLKGLNETITNRPNDAGVDSLHQGKF